MPLNAAMIDDQATYERLSVNGKLPRIQWSYAAFGSILFATFLFLLFNYNALPKYSYNIEVISKLTKDGVVITRHLSSKKTTITWQSDNEAFDMSHKWSLVPGFEDDDDAEMTVVDKFLSSWSSSGKKSVATSTSVVKLATKNFKLPEHAKKCVSFYSLLKDGVIAKTGKRNWPKTTLTLIGAYAYPDYSVVTIEADGWYGQKVYCHYLDANWDELGSPVESIVFPEFAVHCCRHPKAVYMGITESKDEEVSLVVPVLDRTVDNPKYNLSLCLAPMYGNESKWLLLVELIEHYKLQGVQHFYIYVKDIDDYSRLLIDDYEKSGDAEVVYFRKEQDRVGKEWQLVGVEDCLQRSRHHSRYAIFADLDERILALGDQTLAEYVPKAMTEKPNVGVLQFRTRWVLRTRKPPDTYEGIRTLKKHLPTLVFHNTSAVAPPGHTLKCVLDPRRVLLMWVHAASLYFPGYDSVRAPPDKAIKRHYRDLIDDNWGKTYIHGVEGFGNFTMTDYPDNLMRRLYDNVRKRLDRVYRIQKTRQR